MRPEVLLASAFIITIVTHVGYFRVTPLDALVFGHLFAIVTTVLPKNYLSAVIRDFNNLHEYLLRINERFYGGETLASPLTSR